MNLPKYYSLFEQNYSDDFSPEQLFIIRYETIPSSRRDKTLYGKGIINELVSIGFKKLCTLQNIRFRLVDLKPSSQDGSEQTVFYNDEKKIIVKTRKTNDKGEHTMSLYYSLENGELDEQIDLSKIKQHITTNPTNNISLIKSHGGGFWDLEDYSIDSPKIDLDLNYGEGFVEINKTILKRLNKRNDKGIVLLHGEPGTGKTTYIKYLTSEIKDKKVIFVPPMMAESLTDPAIIPFLMEYKNSVLVIEDAEKVLGSRENNSGTSQSTSNLLNLTDGILGDCLNIQIIATFNTKRENIDEAFMRRGRLIAEYKFGKLSVDSTNKLLKILDKNIQVEEEMVLSDIYNIDVDIHKSINEKNKIGFN